MAFPVPRALGKQQHLSRVPAIAIEGQSQKHKGPFHQHPVHLEKTSKQEWLLEKGHSAQLPLWGLYAEVAAGDRRGLCSGLGLYQVLSALGKINKMSFLFFLFKKS